MRPTCRTLLLFTLTAVTAGVGACAGPSAEGPPRAQPRPAQPRSAQPPAAAASPRETDPPGAIHVVKPGDTLWAIAHRHNSSVDEIAEVNGLSNADELTVGQSLFIPAPDDLAPPGDASPRPASPTSATPARDDKRPPPILAWPLDEGVLFSGFGPRHGSLHDGIDLGAPEGTPIRAAADGTVLFAGADPGAYGLLVILQHPEERITIYAHNQANLVKEGEQVKKGQVIAKVGRTGYVQGPHLHFELRQQRKPIDPVPFLPPE